MAEDDRTAQGPVDDDGTAAGSGAAEQRTKAEVRTRILFWAILVGITVVFSAWRVYQFADLEPRTDQAFTTAWARSLIHAERLFPDDLEGAGFVERLAADEDSLLNILLRQIALANDLIFTVVSLAWFAVLTVPFGGSMPAQVVASIVAGGLAVATVSALPFLRAQGGPPPERGPPVEAVGLLCLVLAFGSSFLNLFSAMGFHNFGVFMLIAGVVAAERWMARFEQRDPRAEAWRSLAIIVAVHGVACYSHYTNVFLLPPATVLLLIANRGWSPAARLRVSAFYGAGIVLFLAPAIVLAVLSPAAGHEGAAQDFMTRLVWVFSQEGNSPHDWLRRAGGWFSTMATMTSAPALVMGLVGLVAMARRQELRLPLLVVALHFLLGVAMSGFTQYNRTGAYAIPFLFLGMAWSLVWCWRALYRSVKAPLRRPVAVAAIGAVLALHLAVQLPGFADPAKVPMWSHFVRQSAGFRSVVKDVEQAIPAGAVLIAWDYPLVHRFRSLSQRAWTDYRIVRPAESLVREHRAGRLREYLSRFRIDIPDQSAVFVFAKATRFDDALKNAFLSVFGGDGFGWSRIPAFQVVKPMEWQSRGHTVADFVLYRVR